MREMTMFGEPCGHVGHRASFGLRALSYLFTHILLQEEQGRAVKVVNDFFESSQRATICGQGQADDLVNTKS